MVSTTSSSPLPAVIIPANTSPTRCRIISSLSASVNGNGSAPRWGRFLLRAPWNRSAAPPISVYPSRGSSMTNAAKSGSFSIGGKANVHRLGFGAMRITGDGVWGPPKNKAEALATLRRAAELGIDFIDTADSYGPDVSENLIREALYPYNGVLIATKGGLTRSGPDRWSPKGDPDYLIKAAKRSRERLKVETIALWQLHRIDHGVPRAEQFGAIKSLLYDGVIAQAGLSGVSVQEIEAARK